MVGRQQIQTPALFRDVTKPVCGVFRCKTIIIEFMRMKRLLTALSVVATAFQSTVPMIAQSSGSFVVSLRNGENVEFILSERPKLTFPNGKLVVNAADMQSEFDLTEILKSEFMNVNDPSGIESVVDNDGKTVIFNLDTAPGHVLVGGCRNAAVYDMSGKLVLSGPQAGGELIDFDMTCLQPGVYVIYTPARSIKYSKQ